jgi:hypothetical protein
MTRLGANSFARMKLELRGSALLRLALGPVRLDPWLFPHPFLVEYRELLGVLAELAEDPALAVYVAIDPHRVGRRDKLQYRLLEDYWDGLKLTPQTLDSLDRSVHPARSHQWARATQPSSLPTPPGLLMPSGGAARATGLRAPPSARHPAASSPIPPTSHRPPVPRLPAAEQPSRRPDRDPGLPENLPVGS